MNPFEEVYGQKTPSVLSYILGVLKVQEDENNIAVREAILRTLKKNLDMTRNPMKQQADQGHFE
jgi:hypothetical protein